MADADLNITPAEVLIDAERAIFPADGAAESVGRSMTHEAMMDQFLAHTTTMETTTSTGATEVSGFEPVATNNNLLPNPEETSIA